MSIVVSRTIGLNMYRWESNKGLKGAVVNRQTKGLKGTVVNQT